MLPSTEDAYAYPENSSFCPKFAQYRSKIDYTYYKNYTYKRQRWQDNLITSILHTSNIKRKKYNTPLIMFTCGAYGSGKGSVVKHLKHASWFDSIHWLQIDPDRIKSVMPENVDLVAHDRVNASSRMHKESTFISLLLQYIAMDTKISIIVDGSLYNHIWYTHHFAHIRLNYPSYKIGIVRVETPLDICLSRCLKREKQTHRYINAELIANIYKKIPTSFANISPLANLVITVNNTTTPIITSVESRDIESTNVSTSQYWVLSAIGF